jgi:hypothetical protein
MYSVGKYVMLHTWDSWNGLSGIISRIIEDLIIVFCVHNPTQQYLVPKHNADYMLEIIELNKVRESGVA